MTLFRTFLVALFLAVVLYTIPVVMNHGLGRLFSIFFGDIQAMSWPGQFNLDFFGFLLLSALWVAWRHHFKPVGLLLGLIASVSGIPFLTAYLFIASFKADGDVKVLLLGEQRAAA